MVDHELDVVGVGNAIVDVLAQASDEFLAKNGLAKGSMTLIDEARAEELYASMGPGLEASGGSAANTMAGLAFFGGKPAYIGRVCNDQLGEIFSHDMRASGVAFSVPPATGGPSTARCLILVTPDAQRTMNTYLGACVNLGPEDIDESLVRRGKVLYLEGYLWDKPKAKEAFIKAARIAAAAGRKVALSLSDSFCVSRHRASFRELVAHHVDVLFANEAEIKALYETDSFDEAARRARADADLVALTRGALGSVLLTAKEQVEISAERIDKVIDTTGAGDLYAAGVLYGITHGESLARAGRRGSIAAAEIISHYGARPESDLRELVSGAALA